MPDHATSTNPAVQAQLDRFAQLSPGRDVLGLERIAVLLDRLGRPHKRLPPVFHVAGTNGKGSTCAFLRSILETAGPGVGRRVHVYTSPHLVRFNERIRVAGSLIEDEVLAPLLGEVLDAAHDTGASFFEVTTAAALLAFARTPADACVIEVGLGGRLDATNVVAPVVTGIAQVGIDHQAFLGDTLAQIAGEKAGIAKPGVPLVCLAQPPQALAAIVRVAAAAQAPLWLEGRDWEIDEALAPSLPGRHQLRNANLAAQMVARSPFAGADVGTGIGRAQWPARLQRLAPGPLAGAREVWIDGAHNADAADALATELARAPRHVILGILANKDDVAIVGALADHALSLTFVPVPGHASHDPAVLAEDWGATAAATLAQALHPTEPSLIAGSLYLCGEALRLNGEEPR